MSEDIQGQNTNEANEEDASSSTTTGKTRSNVWLYFERVPIGPDGVKRASCTSCGTTYATNSGTSNMRRHIGKCFEVIDVSAPPQKRARLDQNIYKEKIAISIIKHNYPFSYVEMLSNKVGDVESGLRKLYNGYKVRADAMHDLNLATSQNVAGENPSDELVGFESFKSRYDKKVQEKSQLDKYLEEPPLDRFHHPDLNILQYWKENQGRYPELALMARDILSIPITTVASESSFSMGGRILSKFRSSLLSDNVEALLCTRDWIYDQDGEGEDIRRKDKEIEKRLIEDIEKLIT